MSSIYLFYLFTFFGSKKALLPVLTQSIHGRGLVTPTTGAEAGVVDPEKEEMIKHLINKKISK